MAYNPNASNCQGVGTLGKLQVKEHINKQGLQISHASWASFNDATIMLIDQAVGNAELRGSKRVQPQDFDNIRVITKKSFMKLMTIMSEKDAEEEDDEEESE